MKTLLATRLGAILLLAALSSTERAGNAENVAIHSKSSSKFPESRHIEAPRRLKSDHLMGLTLSLRGGGRIWEDLYEPEKDDNAPGKYFLAYIVFCL
jgi:hypothetical protein